MFYLRVLVCTNNDFRIEYIIELFVLLFIHTLVANIAWKRVRNLALRQFVDGQLRLQEDFRSE